MTKAYALFDDEGVRRGSWRDDIYPPEDDGSRNRVIPAEAIEIREDQWIELINNEGLRRWQDGKVVAWVPPEPEPGPVVLYPADLWRRTTDDEAEQIEAAMNVQSARLRNLFRTAQTYQSDDPLWSALLGVAVELFGEARAAELLAPSGA